MAPEMLVVSRAINPDCEHIEGDMRRLRLDRAFDAVAMGNVLLEAEDIERFTHHLFRTKVIGLAFDGIGVDVFRNQLRSVNYVENEFIHGATLQIFNLK